MTEDDARSRAIARWSLANLVRIAETATSFVYRADRAGEPVALKCFKPDGMDEMQGVLLLEWLDGDGAVRIYGSAEDMVLMEWLDGAPASALVHAGNDTGATAILAEVLARLHAPRANPPAPLESLRDRFVPLLSAAPSRWPEAHRDAVACAVAHAVHLLDTAPPAIPLHGDFHHDNVIASPRGWCAIDPKGVLGDPAYDLANVFRNPWGAEEMAGSPTTIARRAATFSERLGLRKDRLLGWAAAHCALSTCWSMDVGNPIDADLALLPGLLAAARAVSS